jgi:hypothetical protein
MPIEKTEQAAQKIWFGARIPTKEMLDAVHYAALSEDAVAVWEKMIEAWLSQNRELR